jgi:hypothetical protein
MEPVGADFWSAMEGWALLERGSGLHRSLFDWLEF